MGDGGGGDLFGANRNYRLRSAFNVISSSCVSALYAEQRPQFREEINILTLLYLYMQFLYTASTGRENSTAQPKIDK